MQTTDILEVMTPEIHARFKTAVETRKWPDGQKLSQHQLETCLQAIIVYENEHYPANERTAYVPPKNEPCSHDEEEQTLHWKK